MKSEPSTHRVADPNRGTARSGCEDGFRHQFGAVSEASFDIGGSPMARGVERDRLEFVAEVLPNAGPRKGRLGESVYERETQARPRIAHVDVKVGFHAMMMPGEER